MRLFQFTTLVALAASASALSVPGLRRDTQQQPGKSLQNPHFSEHVKSVMNKTFTEVKSDLQHALKEIKPHMDKIMKKIEHPEVLEALKPKIAKAFQDLKPEFDKAVQDTRSLGEVMKEMKPKVDEAFKELKPELEKVWNEIKPGLGFTLEILGDGLIATVIMAAIVGVAAVTGPILPILLIGLILCDPGIWDE
jgi:histidinol dehydrogenase